MFSTRVWKAVNWRRRYSVISHVWAGFNHLRWFLSELNLKRNKIYISFFLSQIQFLNWVLCFFCFSLQLSIMVYISRNVSNTDRGFNIGSFLKNLSIFVVDSAINVSLKGFTGSFTFLFILLYFLYNFTSIRLCFGLIWSFSHKLTIIISGFHFSSRIVIGFYALSIWIYFLFLDLFDYVYRQYSS